MVGFIVWMSVDIVTDGGAFQVHGDIWKMVAYTWIVYSGGILTHYFWITAKYNSDSKAHGLKNSRPETNDNQI